MNSKIAIAHRILITLAVALGGPGVANANINMSVYVRAISQVGVSAGVNLGHAVSATTDMNRLYAGGAFTATCANPHTGFISGERYLPSSQLFGGNSLVVTIPETFPAVRDMPGFDLVAPGTRMACTYAWKASAEESAYTIGAGGIGMTVGGDKRGDANSVPFEMYQPGSGDAEPSHGCLP